MNVKLIASIVDALDKLPEPELPPPPPIPLGGTPAIDPTTAQPSQEVKDGAG